ncbi:MAG: aminodeoxychorismate synthase component I [Thermoleophilia bacterium]|nr:aminodeoxychorismate synthase component I [Thermoleophilia bacterium]
MPRSPGTCVFAGQGAWLPRAAGSRRQDETWLSGLRGDETLVFSDPSRILVATTPDEVHGLLDEVDAEQLQGNYVAGYLAYEAGAAYGLTVQTPAPDALPLAWMAVFPPGSLTALSAEEWQGRLDALDLVRLRKILSESRPRLSVTRDEYVEAIKRVREYIAAGDTYQVNYTVRGRYELTPDWTPPAERVDPLDYFLALVVRQAVPYAAYLDLGDAQVISLSPEMFVRRDGRQLESRPMKGTRPRSAVHAEDVALAYELAETEKERAENLMIVDMVRNDLGRVCRAGSVHVPTLYAVEPYRTVWQMTSVVTGDVNPRASLDQIMRAVFPGASITGAPKHHTMEIIAELETEPREVYTGAIGCFFPGGDFTCNIPIRTIIHKDGRCKLGTGSGIVWDADPASEYEETLVKATFATPPETGAWRADPAMTLMAAARSAARTARGQRAQGSRRVVARPSPAGELQLFETILLGPRDWDATIESPDGVAGLSTSLGMSDAAILDRYRFLEDHLRRMAASAEALGFSFDRAVLLDLLVGMGRITPQPAVVHVDLDAHAGFNLSQRALPEPPKGPVALLVSPFRTEPGDPFLQHKTTVRGFYNREHRRAEHAGCFDALFLNRLDRVTEGAITNVFARFGERWVTPPLTDGLLPGIWRAWHMLETAADEQSLTLDELLTADEVVVGNSVRGAVPVERVVADPVTF